MSFLTLILAVKTLPSMNPLTISFSILAISILSSTMIFKSVMTSWLAFVVILTFSSGMMILFVYTTSLAPNEKMKNKKKTLVLILLTMLITHPNASSNSLKEPMKNFSTQKILLTMAGILLISMLAISSHTYSPNQTVSSNF